MKRSAILLAALGLLALAASGASVGSVDLEMRPVWQARGFEPASHATFCFETLKEPNGLSEDVWAAVRGEFKRGMEAKGYRYQDKTGSLRLSYGAFPPNDVSHPQCGLFLKLRVGTGLLDQPKWTSGAMANAPYDENTMTELARALVQEVPARRTEGTERR
ncbi:MAG: hypothetical protein JO317_07930 [Verrucomicrobiae bacterium]|nr:hypothetical protein [Verrucomicrobiae bacterium]